MIREKTWERDQPLPNNVTLYAFQVMPDKPDEEYVGLKESVRRDGRVTQPIVIDAQGNIIDGHHRYRAWQELVREGEKIERPRCIIRHDLYTDTEKRAVARELNASQRSLTRDQRRQLLRQQLLDTPYWSNRRIAEAVSMHGTRVKRMRETMESKGEIDYHDRFESKDGFMHPRSSNRTGRKTLEDTAGYVEAVRYDPTTHKDIAEPETAYSAISQADRALDTEQTKEARRTRRLKNAYRKTVYALQQLTEATTEDAAEVASVLDEQEAAWLSEVYGHTGEWLEWFVLNLKERRQSFEEEEG